MPDEVQQQYDALQQCLLVLRRAHLCGRPDEPVKALASAGLLDMKDVVYQDVLAKLSGVGPWLQYMEVQNAQSHTPLAIFAWAIFINGRQFRVAACACVFRRRFCCASASRRKGTRVPSQRSKLLLFSLDTRQATLTWVDATAVPACIRQTSVQR